MDQTLVQRNRNEFAASDGVVFVLERDDAGIALIALWAVRAFDMLGAAEANRAPIIIGVLIALAVLVVLCLIAYAAVRAVGRFTSR